MQKSSHDPRTLEQQIYTAILHIHIMGFMGLQWYPGGSSCQGSWHLETSEHQKHELRKLCWSIPLEKVMAELSEFCFFFFIFAILYRTNFIHLNPAEFYIAILCFSYSRFYDLLTFPHPLFFPNRICGISIYSFPSLTS